MMNTCHADDICLKDHSGSGMSVVWLFCEGEAVAGHCSGPGWSHFSYITNRFRIGNTASEPTPICQADKVQIIA